MHVVIPTHERTELLQRTLTSLSQCDLPGSYQGTLVVENGSKVGAESVVQEFERTISAHYLFVKRGNKSYALNHALNQVEEGLVVFFDDDVRLHPQVLNAYAESAADSRSGVFYGGPTSVDYEVEPPDWIVEYFPASGKGWSPNVGQDHDELLFLGFNWAAWAQDLKAVGGFNTSIGPGTTSTGQETELQQRLIANGVRSQYIPDARVWHYVPESRITPEWVLKRAHKGGVGHGRLFWDASGGLAGFPLWVWKSLLKALARYLKALPLGARARFDARYSLVKLLGKMKGAKIDS